MYLNWASIPSDSHDTKMALFFVGFCHVTVETAAASVAVRVSKDKKKG